MWNKHQFKNLFLTIFPSIKLPRISNSIKSCEGLFSNKINPILLFKIGEKLPEVTVPLTSPDIPMVSVLAIFLESIVNFCKLLCTPSDNCVLIMSEPK